MQPGNSPIAICFIMGVGALALMMAGINISLHTQTTVSLIFLRTRDLYFVPTGLLS